MIKKTKNVAPSTDLRQWYNNDPASWKEFKTRYLRYMEYRRAGNQSVPYGINEDGGINF